MALRMSGSALPEKAFSDFRLRVRYAETDQMGVVYHANYLIWFEVGRIEFLRQRGFRYRDLEREEGVFLAVAEVHCRYIAAVHYDEEVIVRTRVRENRRRFITFHYQILRAEDEALVAEGETRHIVLGLDKRPRSLPEKYIKCLQVDSSE